MTSDERSKAEEDPFEETADNENDNDIENGVGAGESPTKRMKMSGDDNDDDDDDDNEDELKEEEEEEDRKPPAAKNQNSNSSNNNEDGGGDDDDDDSKDKDNDTHGTATATTTTTSTSTAATSTVELPPRPVKRGRNAYMIFCDEMRPALRKEHPGKRVTEIATLLGDQWKQLSAEQKLVYQEKSSTEKELIAKQTEEYHKAREAAGLPPLEDQKDEQQKQSHSTNNPYDLILPVARIRKIAKLDPEIKNLSKEAITLVTKCTELFTASLGKETTKIARTQNRRKLLPEDVAHVCRHRDQYQFLKDDIKDLIKFQKEQKENNMAAAAAAAAATAGDNGDASSSNNQLRSSSSIDKNQLAAQGSKPLTAYFGSTTTTTTTK